jgi:hypothetical protein
VRYAAQLASTACPLQNFESKAARNGITVPISKLVAIFLEEVLDLAFALLMAHRR